MEKLMQLAAKKAAKKAKKRAGKKRAKPAPARVSDAELAADLRTAAENYNAALRQKKAAQIMLDKAITAAQAAGLEALQDGGSDGEVSFPSIIRPL